MVVAKRETADANVGLETPVFRRGSRSRTAKRDLDEIWPVHPTAVWPKDGMSLRREDIYADRA